MPWLSLPAWLSEVKLVLRSAKSDRAKVKLNTKVCPLEWYFHRRLLTQLMYESGCMFRRDFKIASVGRVTAVDGDLAFGPGQRDLTDVQLDAMQRINKAMRSLSRRSAAIVFTICGAGLSAADYERAMKWKKGYGLERLREALNELAEHKGLIKLNYAVLEYVHERLGWGLVGRHEGFLKHNIGGMIKQK